MASHQGKVEAILREAMEEITDEKRSKEIQMKATLQSCLVLKMSFFEKPQMKI